MDGIRKTIYYDIVDNYGIHLEIVKPREGIVKMASDISDECLKHISKLEKADTDITYALTNAVGSGEYWGSNKNADYLIEGDLAGGSLDFGYQTFLKAHVFRDHLNKDPKYKVGDVLKAFWNPRMHRVELLIGIYKHRAPEIVQRLNNMETSKELVGVSFGLTTPYEQCSYCGNVNTTRSTRCYHLKYELNKVYSDGSKVQALTFKPLFYDISFVWNRANSEALVLVKLASVEQKEAIVEKEVVSQNPSVLAIYKDLARKVVGKIVQIEPDLSPDEITVLAKKPLKKVMGSLTAMGIILKPDEFKALVSKKKNEASDIAKFSMEDLDNDIFDLMLPRLHDRSYYRPFVLSRAIENQDKLKKTASVDLNQATPELYKIYRGRIIKEAKSKKTFPLLALLIALGIGAYYGRKTLKEVPELGKFPHFLEAGSINPISTADIHNKAMAGIVVPSIPVKFNERYKDLVAGVPAAYVLSAYKGLDFSDKDVQNLAKNSMVSSVYETEEAAKTDVRIIESIYKEDTK